LELAEILRTDVENFFFFFFISPTMVVTDGAAAAAVAGELRSHALF
jgi:hypothetical protein